MSITVKQFDLHVANLRTRMPFRYGIATLTAVPHLFVRVVCDVNGTSATGLAADVLPPKWFKKDPDQPYREEVAEQLHVIESACGFAEQIGECQSVFDLWQQVHAQQVQWASRQGYPPLLFNFGVSLLERAAIDAWCRGLGTTFAAAVADNALGIRLGEIHRHLADVAPADLLPAEPLTRLHLRHTVGLGDPLTDDEIADDERCDDGLAQSLAASIGAYGLTHFKLKLAGDIERDVQRLSRIAAVIDAACDGDYRFTLDGNENYHAVEPFAELWARLIAEPALSGFLSRLIAVEQPLHRDTALTGETAEALEDWADRPPMIIDESDAMLNSLGEALDAGYVGTSHKNCKGVIKGIVHACEIEHRRRERPDETFILTGEDLTNVGPVALLQDLAAMAVLGIDHVERNGQHYYRGVAHLRRDTQDALVQRHGDLYRMHPAGFATLKVEAGRIGTRSVIAAPFGYALAFDPAAFTPIDLWSFDSLELD